MISLKTGMEGRFKIEKFRGVESSIGEVKEVQNSRVVCADWFDNLILNQGLNYIGDTDIQSAFSFCQVGSGSTPVLPTDTGLNSPVASTNTSQSDSEGGDSSGAPYVWRRVVRRFGAGVAAGNLTEVGMGWGGGSSQLFSRALIVDSGGNPTTITVQAGEYLDVTYEIRIYPPTSDSTGTISLNGVVYDYTARACRAATYDVAGQGWNLYAGANFFPLSFSGSPHTAYAGNIGSILSTPSGSSDSIPYNQGTRFSYTEDSFEAAIEYEFGINDGNIGGIRSVALVVGWGTWQIEFSAQGSGDPIPKDATKSLRLTVTHSWSVASI